MDWRSAETMKESAPKWGEHFLVYRVGGERLGGGVILPNYIGLARYIRDDKTGWALETDWRFRGEPTHWMELPDPPRAVSAQEQPNAADSNVNETATDGA